MGGSARGRRIASTRKTRTLRNWLSPLKRRRHRPGSTIGSLIQWLPRMSLHPRKLHIAVRHRRIQFTHQIRIQHRLIIRLLPAASLPARHPLRDRINYILRIAQHMQTLIRPMLRRPQQIQHRHQLAHIIGALRPTPRMPTLIIHIPSPACRTRITKRRTICCCCNSHGTIIPHTFPKRLPYTKVAPPQHKWQGDPKPVRATSSQFACAASANPVNAAASRGASRY